MLIKKNKKKGRKIRKKEEKRKIKKRNKEMSIMIK